MNLETHKTEFNQLGYTIVREFIEPSTALALRDISRKDLLLREKNQVVRDSDGRESKLTLWYSPGDDVFSRLACSDKMYRLMSYFLDGDVSFFHAKLMNKEPKVGGKWEWHQDYGYWYYDGFLRADMGSGFVALDPSTEENGSLSVIPGSHLYGRLDHTTVGQQAGADPSRVEQIKRSHGVVLCTMNPGDALFFHANTLHCSSANLSEQSRLILISCFFRKDNQSVIDDPRYHHKEIVPVAYKTILDGAKQVSSTMDFSSAEQHIIDR